MTLEELSTQYEAAAQPLRDRIRELRILLSKAETAEAKWQINRRIAELTPILTQMNELAYLTAHYYEIGGGDRDDRYGFNGKRRIRSRKNKTSAGGVSPYHSERIDGEATPDLSCVSHPKKDCAADRRRAGGKQIHRKPHFETNRAENRTDYAIPLGDALLDQFFTKK